MGFNIKELAKIADAKTNMFTLVNLTNLKEVKKSTKITRKLAEDYKEVHNEHWITKATVTLVNSIVTQNKSSFLLTRASLTKLVESDMNHEKRISVSNKEYTRFINHITDYLVDIVKIPRNGKEVMVCYVKLPELLKVLKVDKALQDREIRMFVTGEIIESDEVIQLKQEAAIRAIVNRYLEFKYTPDNNMLQNSFKLASKVKRIMVNYQEKAK